MQITDREANYDISPVILNRWSPRAFTGEAIPEDDLMAMFEAARWAPSSFNSQPWRFVYAEKGTKEWDLFLEFLDEANQTWCKNASVLVVVLSRKNMEYKEKPNSTHELTTGCAFQNLMLEAVERGYVTHGMAGFDSERARNELNVPDVFKMSAMLAISKIADKSILPEDLQENEFPSDRKALAEIVMKGKYRES